ncbi:hypothetical protein AOQ71_19345 [Bradyrhizobium manausense]|uniref:Uncharacterized protein n=1 Tax=Bradyrhizobium manausense TaxID=989370 RepID=A0A0R3DRV3_9BRAD|nr:hypothetical protein AOQ71_19345 [Bradyrhizobium manausense]
MQFNHPHAVAAWETKELTPVGTKRVLVVETYLVLSANAEGHDAHAVNDLLSAAEEYLASIGMRPDCLRLFEAKEIG